MDHKCYRCKKTKCLEEFVKNSAHVTGFSSICKSCKNEYSKKVKKTDDYKKYSREYYQKTKHRNKEKRSFIDLKARFKKEGILIHKDAYDALCLEYSGICGICGRHEAVAGKLNLDHCHVSKKLRGLLCGKCNRALGMFKDDPERVKRAIQYLSKGR